MSVRARAWCQCYRGSVYAGGAACVCVFVRYLIGCVASIMWAGRAADHVNMDKFSDSAVGGSVVIYTDRLNPFG